MKRLLVGLGLLNLALVPLQFVLSPEKAYALFHYPDNDCCKKSQEGKWFCCDQCCTSEDCDLSTDCKDPE